MGRASVARSALALAISAGLITSAPPHADAAFPGSNSKIVYETFKNGHDYEIFSVKTSGLKPKNLTRNQAYDRAPAGSPDGTEIAFQSNREGAGPLSTYQIWVMSFRGVNPRELTSVGANSRPSWSPDGTKIAFESNRDGNYEIYTMNYDGTGQTNITNNASGDYQPSWSPDGNKIAFMSIRDGDPEVFVMDAAGTNQTQLTTNSDVHDDNPDWAPDGSKIAWSGTAAGNRWQIFTMNPDGNNKAQRTNDPAEAQQPSYSPNGTSIVYTRFKHPIRSPSKSGTSGDDTFVARAGSASDVGTKVTSGADGYFMDKATYADVTVKKLGEYQAGSPAHVHYTIIVKNSGIPDLIARGLLISDKLGTGMTFDFTGAYESPNWDCDLNVLPANTFGCTRHAGMGGTFEETVVEFNATITQAQTSYRNDVYLTGDNIKAQHAKAAVTPPSS